MRMFISALALSLGLSGGGLAAGSYGLSATVLDPAAIEQSTNNLLHAQGDSTAIVNQLDHVMGIAVDAGVAANGDPAFAEQVAANRAKVRAAAIAALDDPAMRGAVERSLTSLKEQAGSDSTPVAEVQGTTVAAVAKQELAKQDPALAAQLPETLDPLTIRATQPAAPSWAARLQDMTGTLALVALALVALGLLIAPNRAGVMQRIGRWGLAVGGIPVMLFGLLPSFVLPHLGAIGATLAGLLSGSGAQLVTPAAVLAIGGLGLSLAAGTVAKRNSMLQVATAKR